ncbi:hypothetical protein ACFRKB_28935 [Streptomyces scopuliridis]|uniref:hypothetical protein n=1 Tax=Streptomyces scopuliridis TaxID=452529 RepID=UPI0036952E67
MHGNQVTVRYLDDSWVRPESSSHYDSRGIVFILNLALQEVCVHTETSPLDPAPGQPLAFGAKGFSRLPNELQVGRINLNQARVEREAINEILASSVPLAQEIVDERVAVPGTPLLDWSVPSRLAAERLRHAIMRPTYLPGSYARPFQPEYYLVEATDVFERFPEAIPQEWAQLPDAYLHFVTEAVNQDVRRLIPDIDGLIALCRVSPEAVRRDVRILGLRAWLHSHRQTQNCG